jgi:predicted acetyltransferase
MEEDFEIVELKHKPEIERAYRTRNLGFRIIEAFIEKKTKWAAIKIPRNKRAGFVARGVSRTLKKARFKDKVQVLGFDNKRGEIYLERLDI